MKKIIECVPNFSEGRNMDIIKKITDEIEKIEGVTLLDVDPGKATNRTVVTFVGEPKDVVKAAFVAIQKAAELIDMRKHTGEHPRMGATDVCPFVPVANATMEDCIACAKELGEMVGEKLGIPVYLYENAASNDQRKNLANIRSGEYEGINKKITSPEWKPDFGPAKFNERSGNTAIGARDFLIAFNVNLNTTSIKRANSVAFDVREQGRVDPSGNKDAKGEAIRIAGKCKAVKGIGWFIEEYGIAQVSMNLINTNVTPVHIAFDACVESAYNRGMRVTGSELVGLIPLQSMIDAGKYFLQKQQRSTGVNESDLIKIAIKSMGLDELTPFNPEEKIIEYKLAGKNRYGKLISMPLHEFAGETASESPAPGGGSVSAYVGTLGVSLGIMVANLSSQKKGWENKFESFSSWAEKGQKIKDKLLHLVDEDTNSYNAIMDAFALPKSNAEEKEIRKNAVQKATKYATEVPFKVMEVCYESMDLLQAMTAEGNPNSITDAGVGALCANTAVKGAYLNVKVNAKDITDKDFVDDILQRAEKIAVAAAEKEHDIVTALKAKFN